MKISLILAKSKNNVIGLNNELPWSLKSDLKRFKELTNGHHILMGMNTFNSLKKPLIGRTNLVLSTKIKEKKGAIIFDDLQKAINFARDNDETELFVIGGSEIYKQTINISDAIYLTEVDCDIIGDTFFTFDLKEWTEIESEQHTKDEKNEFNFTFKKLIK